MLVKKENYTELLTGIVKMYGSLERFYDFILLNNIEKIEDFNNLTDNTNLYANEYKYIYEDYQFNDNVTKNVNIVKEIQRKYTKQNFLDCILTNYGTLDDSSIEDFLYQNKINDLESFNIIEAGKKVKVNKEYPDNYIFGNIVKTDYIFRQPDFNEDFNDDFLI